MAIEIRMPALSPTMDKGNLTKWLVAEGDTVESGTILAEIETDKATMEYESIDDGVVGKILVADGSEDIAVGTLIAVLLEDGEDASALDNISAEKATVPAVPVADATVAVKAAPVAAPAAAQEKSGEKRIFSSPLARRIASHKDINIAD
ncbi:MAG: pyruvate dehydrogenase complex dihydrolipoamide acetyltransferase, partial [Alphaproteobacteria bacterium]|nr:pyruvate dehydrogenase complex dihydrolipoamide acetyltransferase [Alphaproteobacteria bacterium]